MGCCGGRGKTYAPPLQQPAQQRQNPVPFPPLSAVPEDAPPFQPTGKPGSYNITPGVPASTETSEPVEDKDG